MKRIPLGNERIKSRLFRCSMVLAVLMLCFLLSVLIWPPLVIGSFLMILAEGILHLFAVHKGWDEFYAFYPGGMTDSFRVRHWQTILSGWLFLCVGVGGSVYFLLLFIEVIPI